MIRAIAATPSSTRRSRRAGNGRGDLLDRRRGRDRDRHHVVDQQRGRRDQRRLPAEVPLRDRVGAAAGRVGEADLAVAEGDRDQQDRDRAADPDAERQGGDAAEDQDAEDLLGRVGRRADRVGAEDRQRLLLRQALPDLLLARERPAEEQRLRRASRPDPPRVGGTNAASFAVSWPGPVQRNSAEWGRSTRTRRSPGLRPWRERRPPIMERPVVAVTARPGGARSGGSAGPAARISAWTAATS